MDVHILSKAATAATALALAGCHAAPAGPAVPPRADDAIDLPAEPSMITVPVDAPLSLVSDAIRREVPRTLWTIDKQEPRCVPARRVRVLGERVRLTPDMGCRITGRVTHGTIRVRGEGDVIVVDMPINAVVSASRVGGTPLHETATASAQVQARIDLDLTPQWTPRARVRLRYGWRTPPGIDFLGNRIRFTEQADAALGPIVRNLERTIERELARLDVRSQVAAAWREGFAVLSLNGANPPVWMRITPQRLSFGGYRVTGQRLTLRLGMSALTQTFIGDRPDPQTPTPLPDMTPVEEDGRIRLFVPVVADYAQLQPVLERALARRSTRPFNVEPIGAITARFDNITIYGTTGGRIAVGMDIFAQGIGQEPTRARIWATARPVNDPGSVTVRFADLQVDGTADSAEGNTALLLARGGWLGETLADALTQNFARDLDSLRGRIDTAIADQRQGALVIQARLTDVETGVLRAAGRGLYLPVWASGEARVTVRPGGRSDRAQ